MSASPLIQYSVLNT